MKNIIVTDKAAIKIKRGYPLIQEKDLRNLEDQSLDKQWIRFTDQKHNFLGDGYIGKQNKGIGWILTRNEHEKMDQKFFINKFQQSKEKRQAILLDELTTAFRIFNGEGDGIGGFTIDIYNDFALFSWYNESIYHFQAEIVSAFQKVFPEIKGIYEKIRFQSNGLPESQHVGGELAEEPLIILENGVSFATYLDDGMMTGIFLDQKEVRGLLVDGLAMGMNVLNTFSYTGAFSVAAAMGGAASTTSVDLAKRSLPKTKEQFEINNLPLETNKIVVMDVFDYFKYAKRKNLSFDMIILDPPSFARSKKHTFSVAKNYGELVAEVLPLLERNGWLVASTNAANVSLEKYRKMVEEGISQNKRQGKLVHTYRLPVDFSVAKEFEEGNYLKVLIYQIK